MLSNDEPNRNRTSIFNARRRYFGALFQSGAIQKIVLSWDLLGISNQLNGLINLADIQSDIKDATACILRAILSRNIEIKL